jgi:hypothetical protein
MWQQRLGADRVSQHSFPPPCDVLGGDQSSLPHTLLAGQAGSSRSDDGADGRDRAALAVPADHRQRAGPCLACGEADRGAGQQGALLPTGGRTTPLLTSIGSDRGGHPARGLITTPARWIEIIHAGILARSGDALSVRHAPAAEGRRRSFAIRPRQNRHRHAERAVGTGPSRIQNPPSSRRGRVPTCGQRGRASDLSRRSPCSRRAGNVTPVWKSGTLTVNGRSVRGCQVTTRPQCVRSTRFFGSEAKNSAERSRNEPDRRTLR